jgi:hypothetical protein
MARCPPSAPCEGRARHSGKRVPTGLFSVYSDVELRLTAILYWERVGILCGQVQSCEERED